MKFEFSAGGVVYKKEVGKTLILVSQHSQHHGWVFPKGLIGDKVENEKKEETATREVEEETGVKAKILIALNPTTYWYVFEGEKIRKTVYYFLMEFISGDFSKRDHEMENVEWLPMEEVENRLTYKSDKDVWQQARGLINT
ncbi:NUDIX domain-containing protein [Patescibacteria group bacterium]|nr:NUDIX domain-containing protein [Patescibacteria group bacterium]